MIEIVLILETADDRQEITFYGTDCLEDFLKTINLNDYEYTSIICLIDRELSYNLTTIFKKRYIDKISKEEEAKLYTTFKKPLPFYD